MAAFDVAVIGGGPAGAATALALRHHDPELRVVLIEASDYGEARIGESLPPNARLYLEKLGVFERFLGENHLESFGTTSSWGVGDLVDNDFLASFAGSGWHLDRRRFDAFLLAEAAREGVVTRTGARVVSETRRGGRWRLELRAGERRAVVTARYVVDAGGRGGRFAARRGARRVLFDWLVGVYAFCAPGERPATADTRTLVEPLEQGWWYSARLPDGGMVAAFMTDGDLVRGAGLDARGVWLEMLAGSRHTRERLEGLERRGEPAVRAASSGRLDAFGGDGWLAVGDAASTFDPLSGQGIVKALANGLWAAFAAADSVGGRQHVVERYSQLLRDEFERYLETRERFYLEEPRWPEAPFWRRRRTRVTLDPRRPLERSPEAAQALARLRMYLPPAELTRLAGLFATPRPAHEAVAAFKDADDAGLSDRRIVLALQYLVEEGVLRTPSY
ncbi:MAG TPA: tryptophan 7-halogenase [Thermoanaerobaculia bacterium]|jgi:flavin-dependent dehydrogenase